MEGLKLIGEHPKEQLHIEPMVNEKVYLTLNYFGDDIWYHINKEDAKQIVEHLTKVFEL